MRAKKIEEAARAVLEHIDCTHTEGDHPCKVYRGGACTCGAQKAINAYIAVEAAFALPPDDERGALERLREWANRMMVWTSGEITDEINRILADMPQQQPATKTLTVTQTGEHFCETQCGVRERGKADNDRLAALAHANGKLADTNAKERDEWKAKAEAAEKAGYKEGGFTRADIEKELKLTQMRLGDVQNNCLEWKVRAEKAEARIADLNGMHDALYTIVTALIPKKAK